MRKQNGELTVLGLKQILIEGLNSKHYDEYVGLFNDAINCYLDYEVNTDLCWYPDGVDAWCSNFENSDGKIKGCDTIRDYYLEELGYEDSDYKEAIYSALNDIKDELIELKEGCDYHDQINEELDKLSDSEFEELMAEQLRKFREARNK